MKRKNNIIKNKYNKKIKLSKYNYVKITINNSLFNQYSLNELNEYLNEINEIINNLVINKEKIESILAMFS